MDYQFNKIQDDARKKWADLSVYKVGNDESRPKCYVLDMFPYPSGAGLHVGHPLGYIASDIYARYKRQRGYNVVHPMGYDAFGLPAEQYALETGQHPAVTTEKNIARYREQLDNIGFSYDWSREVRTSDPNYYKWTQWIFMQLFHSWFDRKLQKARPIKELVTIFEKEGNINTCAPGDDALWFTKDQWRSFTTAEQRGVLMHYRLAYLGNAEVWWCEALGTVLANDEVVNGVSERGGHPVVKKPMRQWFLRITEYAERLLGGLEGLDWSEAMKDMQRNWIGKSNGAEITFDIREREEKITVFTTRPDTLFGVDFMVLAPEHPLVSHITTELYRKAVAEYKTYVASRSERERMSEVKQISGTFTGAYVIHPFTRKPIPVWISEYVLAGYGTGAIMAVPSGDERDYAFARHFEIPITNIFGANYKGDAAYTAKIGTIEGSDFISGLEIPKASEVVIRALEDAGIGKRKVNYKLRDAGFSRQRYWGEPFPVIYHNGIPYTIDEDGIALDEAGRQLPVELPHVETYKPGPEGQGPLANLTDWVETPAGRRETNTMPGYAGSSWYFLRYMDPHNDEEFVSKDAARYWQQVDVYVGGTEHAVGHLLYARMWTKALADLDYIVFDEPFKKLVNQGMIQGSSRFIFRVDIDWQYLNNEIKSLPKVYLSDAISSQFQAGTLEASDIISIFEKKFQAYSILSPIPWKEFRITAVRIPVEFVDGLILDVDRFRAWGDYNRNTLFLAENGKVICGAETEKMSKSKYNVVNPDDIVAQYGSDTFRMYEMFLGLIEVSKPWDTKGIEGVFRFIKKLWRLYYDESGWAVTEEKPTDAELRIIHKTIKKTGEDIERFSFNTAVSAFMICVNDLSAISCRKRDVLEALAVIIAPFAPHLAEALWSAFGHETSVVLAPFPKWEEAWVTDDTKLYPVAINGKTRTEISFPLDAGQGAIESTVLADATVQKWLEGKPAKKVIFVKGRMINVVA